MSEKTSVHAPDHRSSVVGFVAGRRVRARGAGALDLRSSRMLQAAESPTFSAAPAFGAAGVLQTQWVPTAARRFSLGWNSCAGDFVGGSPPQSSSRTAGINSPQQIANHLTICSRSSVTFHHLILQQFCIVERGNAGTLSSRCSMERPCSQSVER